MRFTALLLVAAFLLAGCSGNKSTTDDGTPAGSVTTTSTGPPPPPVVTSDTLHLLDVPEMATALPEGGDEFRTANDGAGFGSGGTGGQAPPEEWNYVIANPANISAGEVRIWVEITETLVQVPLTFPPGQEACTWLVRLELGADNVIDIPCIAEPPGPINPATKELVFPFLGTDATQLETNETVSVRLERRAFGPSTTPSVFILSGTADHDSRVQLTGLKEVVPSK